MLALVVSASEKVRQVSPKDLAYVGLGILVLVAGVLLIKRVAKLNGIVVFLVIAAALFIVGVTWIYQRTEPKFLTPLVDRIAPFLPSAPTPYSQRPGNVPGTAQPGQKPGAPGTAKQPVAPPAPPKPAPSPSAQKPAPPAPSKVY